LLSHICAVEKLNQPFQAWTFVVYARTHTLRC